MLAFYKKPLFAAFLFILSLALLPSASAQSGGSSTSVTGTVVESNGRGGRQRDSRSSQSGQWL